MKFISTFCLLLLTSLSLRAQALMVTLTPTPACNHDGTVTAVVTGGTGPYTYYWFWNNNTQSLTTGSNVLTGIAGGNVNLQVTDANSVNGWGSTWVNYPFTITSSPVHDVCGAGTGSVTASVSSGGTAPFTYLWNTGATTSTSSGLSAGVYDCTITDAAGCSLSISEQDSAGLYVYNTSPVNATTSQTPSACGAPSGTATVNPSGGTAPYTYTWGTAPVQTTQTATGLVGGMSYYVTITDATGCMRNTSVYVYQNNGSFYAWSSAYSNETCLAANGTASANASGGTPPYTYLWNTGGTTPNITGLVQGYYTCTVSDAAGCSQLISRYVDRTSPISLSSSVTQPSCGLADGSLSITPSGGTAPYTYLWTNGATTSSLSSLGVGIYGVTVTDAVGCVASWGNYLTYPQTCFARINGVIVHDNAGNCTSDPGDFQMPQQPISVSGFAWTMTDFNGFYSALVTPGSTYTLSHNPLSNYTPICPVGNSLTVPAPAPVTYANNNFYLQPTGSVQDLVLNMYVDPLRPFMDHDVCLGWFNTGNQAVTATLSLTHDPMVSPMTVQNYYWNSPPYTYNPATYTITWNLGTVLPQTGGQTGFIFQGPVVVGNAFTHSAVLNPTAGDATPANNAITYTGVVTGSYDPNDKHVWPTGLLDNVNDSVLHYTVNFQNTGTDTAFTVVVRDTLDSALDPATFKMGITSHLCEVSMEGNCVVVFTFNNILLPDSNQNEPLSHGWLTYSIQPHTPIAPQTTIENSAAIYFDFNLPVITNTVVSTYGPLAVDDGAEMARDFALIPNPAGSQVNVQFEPLAGEQVQVRLTDLAGAVLMESGAWTSAGAESYKLDLSALSAGLYLVQVQQGAFTGTRRLVVAH